MASTTVRIKEETRQALKQLADQEREPMQEVLARAVETYRRMRMLDELHADYMLLRENEPLWQQELAERTLIEGTLGDDLDDVYPPRSR